MFALVLFLKVIWVLKLLMVLVPTRSIFECTVLQLLLPWSILLDNNISNFISFSLLLITCSMLS